MFVRTLFIVLFVSLTACSSAPPEPQVDFSRDYDFSAVKTVAFLDDTSHLGGSPAAAAWLSDMVHNRVDNGLKYALEFKGFEVIEDEKAADVLIAWHLATEEKTDVRTYDTGFSYGYGTAYGYRGRAMYNCWNCGGTEVRVNQYTQGTFIVDIIDPELKQSVWRSVVQSKLKGEASQEQEFYNVAGLRILGDFPPGAMEAEVK